MSNKEEKKIIEQDIGFAEDIFGMLCDMVAYEDHCDGSFISTRNGGVLKDKNWMRKIRTFHLNKIGERCVGNDWCRLKHLCRIAKGLQETASRHLSVGEEKEAKQCIEHYGECFVNFLKLAKFDLNKNEVLTSA